MAPVKSNENISTRHHPRESQLPKSHMTSSRSLCLTEGTQAKKWLERSMYEGMEFTALMRSDVSPWRYSPICGTEK